MPVSTMRVAMSGMAVSVTSMTPMAVLSVAVPVVRALCLPELNN